MSAISKRRSTPAVPRLEGTLEQISALNSAVILAVFAAEREVLNTRHEVHSFTQKLERAADSAGKSFYTNMLVQWHIHLQRDQQELAKARAALEFMSIAHITRIEEKS